MATVKAPPWVTPKPQSCDLKGHGNLHDAIRKKQRLVKISPKHHAHQIPFREDSKSRFTKMHSQQFAQPNNFNNGSPS